MSDFLDYIRRRRAELQRELEELDVAEHVFRKSGAQLVSAQQKLQLPEPETLNQPKSIKEMAVKLLDQAQPNGLTALQILELIQINWMPGLERTSLSPQLTRLKNDGIIINDKRLWKLATQDELSNETEAPADTGASETSGPGIV